MKETDADEIYQTIKEREEQKEKDTLTKVPIDVKSWLAIGFGLLVLFTFMKYIELMTAIIIGLIGLLALKFIYGDVTAGRELTERELTRMLWNNLRYEQVNPVRGIYRIDPSMVIRVEKSGRRVRYNGVPQERKFLVSFYDPKGGRREWWEYAVDLYTGDTTKSTLLPAGMRDFDARDFKVIVSEDLKDKKRMYAELGVKPRV